MTTTVNDFDTMDFNQQSLTSVRVAYILTILIRSSKIARLTLRNLPTIRLPLNKPTPQPILTFLKVPLEQAETSVLSSLV